MASTLSGNRRTPTDAEIVSAVSCSDSLELVSRQELLAMFVDMVDDCDRSSGNGCHSGNRWTLRRGGEA